MEIMRKEGADTGNAVHFPPHVFLLSTFYPGVSMSFDPSKHARGGNPANTGQFSSDGSRRGEANIDDGSLSDDFKEMTRGELVEELCETAGYLQGLRNSRSSTNGEVADAQQRFNALKVEMDSRARNVARARRDFRTRDGLDFYVSDSVARQVSAFARTMSVEDSSEKGEAHYEREFVKVFRAVNSPEDRDAKRTDVDKFKDELDESVTTVLSAQKTYDELKDDRDAWYHQTESAKHDLDAVLGEYHNRSNALADARARSQAEHMGETYLRGYPGNVVDQVNDIISGLDAHRRDQAYIDAALIVQQYRSESGFDNTDQD